MDNSRPYMTKIHPASATPANLINIGIVGPGRVAHRLANAMPLIEGAQLWSVYSRNLGSAKEFATQYAAAAPAPAYDNFQKMLEDPKLNALIITTPDKFHFYYAFEALKNGKHLLIEKPLCTTTEEGQQLLELAKKTSCVISMGYHLRWHTGLRLLAEKTKEKKFGRINHVSIHWAHTFIDEASWRQSRELSRWWALSTLGTHCLDIARWIMLPSCGEVKNIKCLATNKNFNSNDESAMISLEFESGATATIFTSILFHSPFKIEVYGEKNNAKGVNLVSSDSKGELFINDSPLEYPEPSNLYACELRNFIDAINNKVDAEGFKNIELLIQSNPQM